MLSTSMKVCGVILGLAFAVTACSATTQSTPVSHQDRVSQTTNAFPMIPFPKGKVVSAANAFPMIPFPKGKKVVSAANAFPMIPFPKGKVA
ncbi:MAG TPA: hypothetical protein VFI20_06775 [Terracidiphilus sp.]|nr:hypothetical protein [Terracidiphilus sp.]